MAKIAASSTGAQDAKESGTQLKTVTRKIRTANPRTKRLMAGDLAMVSTELFD